MDELGVGDELARAGAEGVAISLIAGAEGPGLLPTTRARTHYDVRIPMHHGVDSLNLGHALAIAMAAVSPAVQA